MRECNFELNFKKDMTNIEIEGVASIVRNFVYSNEDQLFGAIDLESNSSDFVYTSSSSYAMMGLDGLTFIVPSFVENIEYDELEVSHFAITLNNMLIMVCTDDDENYYYFEIEPSDFY